MPAPLTEREKAYQKAAEVADKLLAEGLPVMTFDGVDAGAACVVVLMQEDGQRVGFRFPADMPFDQAAEVVRGGWTAHEMERRRE